MKGYWFWCVGLGLTASMAALWWFGIRPWTVVFALLLLACPAIILWLAWKVRRPWS